MDEWKSQMKMGSLFKYTCFFCCCKLMPSHLHTHTRSQYRSTWNVFLLSVSRHMFVHVLWNFILFNMDVLFHLGCEFFLDFLLSLVETLKWSTSWSLALMLGFVVDFVFQSNSRWQDIFFRSVLLSMTLISYALSHRLQLV